MASYTTAANGQVILTSGAPLDIPQAQNVQGGLIEAASQKTIASQAASAANYKNLGGGQKGGRRTRKRKVRRGGAQSLNVLHLGYLPPIQFQELILMMYSRQALI